MWHYTLLQKEQIRKNSFQAGLFLDSKTTSRNSVTFALDLNTCDSPNLKGEKMFKTKMQFEYTLVYTKEEIQQFYIFHRALKQRNFLYLKLLLAISELYLSLELTFLSHLLYKWDTVSRSSKQMCTSVTYFCLKYITAEVHTYNSKYLLFRLSHMTKWAT